MSVKFKRIYRIIIIILYQFTCIMGRERHAALDANRK